MTPPNEHGIPRRRAPLPDARSLSRRKFLRLGVGGLGSVALLGGLGAVSWRAGAAYETAESLGIGTENSGTANRESLVEALSGTDRRVLFGPGDYKLENSPDIVVEDFRGELRFEDGGRLLFARNDARGITFAGGGPRLRGMSTAFATAPPVRVAARECVLFEGTTDTLVEDGFVLGSAAAGMLFHNCTRPRVVRLTVRQTRADGLHFANCQDALVDSLRTEDTGDDGLAFLNYESDPDYYGGTARNVDVKRSKARGIAVVGQRGVRVEGFAVSETALSGLYVAYEASYRTRVPRDCVFVRGSIRNPGRYPGQDGNRFGINFEGVDGLVEIRAVDVRGAAERGVSGSMRDTATVVYDGGTVYLPGGSGVHVVADGGTVRLQDVTVDGSPSHGFYVAGAGLIESTTRITAHNCGTDEASGQAVVLENNARVETTEVIVQDDRDPALGYKVAAPGSGGGILGTVRDRVSNGSVVVEDAAGLSYRVV